MMKSGDAQSLSAEQVEQYERDGYIIVPNLLSDEEIDYFLEYARKPKPKGWEQNVRHHVDNEYWSNLARHRRVTKIVRQLLGGRPMIVQTMYAEKPPALDGGVGGSGVALHQDLHYLPCEPETLMGCWLALTDTDAENGGLCVVPGSHTVPGVYTVQRNEGSDDHEAWETVYRMSDPEGREWREHMYSFNIDGVADDEVLRLTVPQGAGVFFTGKTINGSYANRSRDRYRRSFSTHYVREGTWVFRMDVQDLVPA